MTHLDFLEGFATSTASVVLVAVLAPIGAIIGGVIVAFLQRGSDARKWFLDARLRSYMSLVTGASDALVAMAEYIDKPEADRTNEMEFRTFRDLELVSKAVSEISILGPPAAAEAAFQVQEAFRELVRADDYGEVEVENLRSARNRFDREAALGVSAKGPLGRRRLGHTMRGTASRIDPSPNMRMD
jgi:hypothetical protein